MYIVSRDKRFIINTEQIRKVLREYDTAGAVYGRREK